MAKTTHDDPAEEQRPSRGRSRRKPKDEPQTTEEAPPSGEDHAPAPEAPSAPAKGAQPRAGRDARVVVVGPDGRPMVVPAVAAGTPPEGEGEAAGAEEQRTTAGLVDQPTKVIRIGSMIKQLLEEVRTAPLDEAARVRLTEVHHRAVHELEDGLSGDLLAELRRLTLPLGEEGMVPSDAELRIAQAQLVGWLEGLFQSIQTALVAQQVATKSQRRALPPGLVPMAQAQAQGAEQGQQPSPETRPGQYL